PTCDAIALPKAAFGWPASPSSKPWSSSAGTGPLGSTASKYKTTSTSSLSRPKPTSSFWAVWAWGNPNQVTTSIGHSVAPEQTITILDPRHPLCGRTLPLVAMMTHAQLGRCCVVRLGPNVERCVPVYATNLAFAPSSISPTPLWVGAVEQLLRVIHDIHHATQGVSSDASPSRPRGAAAPARPPDCSPSALAPPVRRPATARPRDSARRRATVGSAPTKLITT